MRLADFDYTLPEELIAQEPIRDRDQSRLLVVDRERGEIEHRRFFDILDYLADDDLLVLNDTRVSAVRLFGQKATGGKVEALLMKRLPSGDWVGMVKPGRRVPVGTRLLFGEGLEAEVIDRTEEGGRLLRFSADGDPDLLIAQRGEVPLPPYIHARIDDPSFDKLRIDRLRMRERYQTVYAASDGSSAAPTAGLHFTPALLKKIQARGIQLAYVTLHVGIATFRPVRTPNVEDHVMHTEYVEIGPEAAEVINTARRRIVSVGTTTARALESAAVGKRRVAPFAGETRLFIRPPYEFRIVDGLITNFHMPKSTLLMLVSAYAGVELVRRAYQEAVREQYRFLSFGDAMFLY